jgi:hypothetical protein
MDTMLKSNPGLSSRFNRVLHFDDYSPVELARIFGWLCETNHYKLADGTRATLMLGLTELHRRRDRHFGNGRAVRNLFEHSIRRMANRIADIAELSQEELMLLEAADIEFRDLSGDFRFDASNDKGVRFQIACPACNYTSKAPGKFLGKNVRCRKCDHNFLAEWGEIAALDPR